MRRQTNEQIFRPQKTVMNKQQPADGPSKVISHDGCGRSVKTQEGRLSPEQSMPQGGEEQTDQQCRSRILCSVQLFAR